MAKSDIEKYGMGRWERAVEAFNIDIEEFLEFALAEDWNMQLVADWQDVGKSQEPGEWDSLKEQEENDPYFDWTDKEKRIEELRLESKLMCMAIEELYYHWIQEIENEED